MVSQRTPNTVRTKLLAMGALAAMHLAVYLVVTRINSGRSSEALWNPETPLDGMIPLLEWTWPVFWFAYPFVIVGGAWALWGLSRTGFTRAVVGFATMIVIGGACQLLFPARSPWRAEVGPPQSWVHEAWLTQPFASLPSMHVAFAVLVALFGARAARRPIACWLFAGAAVLISLSAITLKEHWVLDVPAGAVLALGTYLYWRRTVPVSTDHNV